MGSLRRSGILGERLSLYQIASIIKENNMFIQQLAVRLLERIESSFGTEGESGRGRFKLTCWSSEGNRAKSDNGTSSSESSSEHPNWENLGSEGFKGADGLVEVVAAAKTLAAVGTASMFSFSGNWVVSASAWQRKVWIQNKRDKDKSSVKL